MEEAERTLESLRTLKGQRSPSRPSEGVAGGLEASPRGSRGQGPTGGRSLLEREVGSLSRAERSVVAALRRRAFGATARTVAELSGVSVGHVRRCLRRLEQLGWVVRESRSWLWGYEQTRLRVWRLTWSGSCAEMLAFVRHEPISEPSRFDDMVPPEFWFNFWSGTPADRLRISDDGLLIAETLIGGHDLAARQWALAELPVGVLEQCRRLRGCDSGSVAEDIDAAIAERSA